MPGTKTSGNRTGPRGHRPVQRPPLDRDTARNIKVLVLARGWEYTPEAAAKLIAEWAKREWDTYKQELSAGADEAYEGGVL